MPADDIAVVKQAFAAFAVRDRARLEELSSAGLVLPTGSAVGEPRYEGRDALARYLVDVERVWDRLELRPADVPQPASRRRVRGRVGDRPARGCDA
jgi:hypothetical protein